MNLLVDENVDKSIVDELRQNGHNVLYIAEFAPSINDETVLHQANQNRALLLTEDKDFGELVFRQSLVHYGCITCSPCWFVSTSKIDNYFNRLCKSRERTARNFPYYFIRKS